MKNSIRAIAIAAAVASIGLAAVAIESTVVGGVTWYYTKESYYGSGTDYGKTVASIVKGGDAYTGNLTIPSALDGYKVKYIGSDAFENCAGLTGITIPSTVTSIGYDAFSGCSGLTSVTIPDSVTSISGDTFENCRALRTAVLPSGLTSIPSYLFNGCSALTSVDIPSGVTSIGSYAFYQCSALGNVTLPSGLQSIGSSAFYGCAKFTRLDLPTSVASVGDGFIRGCSDLTSITVAAANTSYKVVNGCLVSKSGTTLVAVPYGRSQIDIPTGVAAIPDSMFNSDGNLTSVTIPAGVTSIGEFAFSSCSSLTSVTIPVGVTSIGRYAFYYCTSLTSVTIPAGVTSIGEHAFYYTSLASVTIPASVTTIGSYAFYNRSRGFSGPAEVTFLGAPPSGVKSSYLLGADHVTYLRDYGAAWQKLVGLDSFTGFGQLAKPSVTIVSSQIRANDPTVLDVVYRVTSAKARVKVRALAFEDGVRSFAKVVRPETFIEGTAANIGDAVTANADHKLSWRVSSDWQTDLAKMKFEVLAVEDDLLPFELVTIPAGGNYGQMDVSWNVLSSDQYLDALFWLYADKTADLTVTGGKLACGSTNLVNGASLVLSEYYRSGWQYDYPSVGYVFGKMGYEVLSGERLEYVKEETRLSLSPSRLRQYAVKEQR